MKNILLLGSGGREHAFARALCAGKQCGKLFIAPGNAGTALFGTNVDVLPNNFLAIKNFVLTEKVNLVVVGPEDPLVKGIRDFFLNDNELKNIPVIGPSADGAQLEGSKDFSKAFMLRHQIPTAAYKSFTSKNVEEGFLFLESLSAPYVLKADGLAAGKGVLIVPDLAVAKQELKAMLMDHKFGSASDTVVIEEFLPGIEVSVFVLTDGKNYKILPEAKDYKRIGEGDTGLNTGGMGAVSPVPFFDEKLLAKIEERIVQPTINGLRAEQIDYRGFIFIGLMVDQGEPKVIEYNCRMGDPETEVVLPRIKTDFLELMQAVADQQLDKINLEIDFRTAVTVMMVSGGYPGDYTTGFEITGIEDTADSIIFHAGTKINEQQLVTNGGRVLAVTSLAENLDAALKKVFTASEKINFEGSYYRKDIGNDLKQF